MEELLTEISKCTICAEKLDHEPRPVVAASSQSKVAIIGQAPGRKVHASGVPWDDPSGKQLRKWLDVTDEEFYDPDIFAIVPMGFCYPGHGKSADLPPRKECAPQWHESLLEKMPDLSLILLIGRFAQSYYLGDAMKRNLTETVGAFESYLPTYLPLPHPSPRNRFWLSKNPWFDTEVVPTLQAHIKTFLPEK